MAQWVVDRFKYKINGRAETEKFVDHWLAASGQRAIKRDWVAAWRNWMRNAAEFAAARPNGNGTSAAYVEPRERRCPIHPGHLEATCRPCEAEHRAREPPQLGAFDPYPPHPNGAS